MTPRYGLVDCNNFFVSCERVFRPDLWEKPVAVLSNNDGCIIARSNEVKSLGIPMGVPLFKVKTLLAEHKTTLFSANFELYGDMSQRIVSILREETPLIEVYSVDECFIDLSQLSIADYHEWGVRVAMRIFHEVGIPVSIGLAPTKTLAKVASTYAKTHGDGVAVIHDDITRRELLADLPIEEVWGIGRQLAPKLKDKGVSYALQLSDAQDAWLAQQFTITGLNMTAELRGEPRLKFGDKHERRKSIGRSRSFGHMVRDYYQLESAVATFTAQAASKLRAQDSICVGVVTYLTTGRHAVQTKSASTLTRLSEATMDTGALIACALTGLEAIYDPDFSYQKAGILLVGITGVEEWQLAMLGGDEEREKKVDIMSAVDSLNARFGKGAIWHASEMRLQAKWQSKHERRSPRYTTQISELPLLQG